MLRPEGIRGWDRASTGWSGRRGASSKLRAPQFFQVPYTALTMLLTPSPRERDSATAYRECAPGVEGGAAPGWAAGSVP